MSSPVHETHTMEQLVAAPVAAVWAAYADPDVRAQWAVPEGEAQVFDSDGLRTGGAADYRCGDPSALQFQGRVHFVLVEPESLIVHTETVSSDGAPLSAAQITWRFIDEGEQTRVEVVDQVTSFVGPEMIEGHRNGHTKALQQLAQRFS